MAGNHALAALQAMQNRGDIVPGGVLKDAKGWLIPCVDVSHLSRSEAEAFAIADNRTVELAENDDSKLATLLSELNELAGLDGTGYDSSVLEQLLQTAVSPEVRGEAPEPEISRAEELRGKWQVERGQVWKVGRHRLMCGDSASAGDMKLLMEMKGADVLWTDPPYGVDYVGKTKAALKIDNDSAVGLEPFLLSAFTSIRRHLNPCARFYIAAPAGPQGTVFRTAVRDAGLRLHEVLVWVKSSMVLGHSDYHYQHEDVLYGWNDGPGRPGRGAHDGTRWYGDHSQTTVFAVDKPTRNADHPTVKPVELIRPMLENSSRKDDVVLDSFAGSGSTFCAAEEIGRTCFGMEIDPGYAAVTLERLAAMGMRPEPA
jgi:DNA modification methylase